MDVVADQPRPPVVLIPAFNPDRRLIALLKRLTGRFPRIVVVNDGSVSGSEVFDEAKPLVERILVHEVNRGKGAAIRTGLAYIGDADDVITADADGQHTSEDIIRVAEGLRTRRHGLVLGVRAFSGDVPFRSRFGNFFTRWLFFALTGLHLRDTQTGLRGIPAGLVKRMLSIAGDRYEYEMAMLADARHHAERPLQIPIATVYLENNATSHFNPLLDTLRICGTLFSFCLSSVLSFLLDNALFAVGLLLLGKKATTRGEDILIALAVARLVSSHFNYFFNRFLVFRKSGRRLTHGSYWRYFCLVAVIALASWGLTEGASALLDAAAPAAITVVKIAADTVLFVASYYIQKKLVFRS